METHPCYVGGCIDKPNFERKSLLHVEKLMITSKNLFNEKICSPQEAYSFL